MISCPVLVKLGITDIDSDMAINICVRCDWKKCFYDMEHGEKKKLVKSERKAEVKRLVSGGFTLAEIARKLNVSVRTVQRTLYSRE